MATAQQPRFVVNETFVCLRAPNEPHEAKVVKIEKRNGVQAYVVHLQGWDSVYDITIPVTDASKKMIKGSMQAYRQTVQGSGAPRQVATPKQKSRGESAAPPTQTMFAVNEELICLQNGQPYEAKVIDIKEHHGVLNYIVHFKGWNSRHDEKVPVGKEDGKMYEGSLVEYKKRKEVARGRRGGGVESSSGSVDESDVVRSFPGLSVKEATPNSPAAQLQKKTFLVQQPSVPTAAPTPAPQQRAPVPHAKFVVNETFVCVHTDNNPYEAKVMEILEENGVYSYLVHFQGWNSRYDQKIPFDSEAVSMFKGTLEAYKEAHGIVDMTKFAGTPKLAKKRTAEETSSSGGGHSAKKATPTSSRVAIKTSTPVRSRGALFSEGEVLVSLQQGIPYEAKIVKIEDQQYLVHYNGWNKRYDEWVEFSQARGKMFKGTVQEYKNKYPEETALAMKQLTTPRAKLVKANADESASEEAESTPKRAKNN